MPDLEVLKSLIRIADGHGLRILLVGAMARQLVFDERLDGAPYRATLDIDAVVRVEGWEEFDALVDSLRRGGFTKQSDHRFRHELGEIDLLPFGGVADADGNLTWQGGDRVMSLEGLEVAEANSETIDLDGVSVPVASLANLVALKLYAFRDRFPRIENDLRDLVHIFDHATDVELERAYRELGGELAELEYRQVGPYLLGRDLAASTPAEERAELRRILEGRILDGPAYAALNRVMRGRRVEGIVSLFEAFRAGLFMQPGER